MTPLRRAFLLLALCAVPVYPCGGPETYPINAPLVTLDAQFDAVQTVSDGLEMRVRPELRFLYPFRGTAGVNDALWAHQYQDAGWNPPSRFDSTATFVRPDTQALHVALASGNKLAADAAARAFLDRTLDLPAAVADEHVTGMRHSVAWLEGADRRGSEGFEGIKASMRERLPNGWANDFRDSVPDGTWRDLAVMHERWLASHAAHPLAPWVGFSRARLAYFQGDTAGAWEPWLALYAAGKHRPRVLGEMRYLLLQGFQAPEDARIDGTLRAALLVERSLGVPAWNREWTASASLPPAARVAVQERLLWHAARRPLGDSLDHLTSFPRDAARPSTLWAELRALVLARGGRRAAALRQLDGLEADSVIAPLRAQLLLGMGRWSDGIRTPAIPFASRQYLLRVLAPDSVVATIAKGTEAELAREARLVQSIRLAAAGRWAAAIAALPHGQSRRAALWRTATTMSADTSARGQLAYARWLRQRNGSLFYGNDKAWYRSLNWRIWAIESTDASHGFNPQLPWTAQDEARAIGRHFRESFELYAALRTWVAWLQRPAVPPTERRRVAREADAAYRWLVDWDANNSGFWKQALEAEGIGPAIRVAAR